MHGVAVGNVVQFIGKQYNTSLSGQGTYKAQGDAHPLKQLRILKISVANKGARRCTGMNKECDMQQ